MIVNGFISKQSALSSSLTVVFVLTALMLIWGFSQVLGPQSKLFFSIIFLSDGDYRVNQQRQAGKGVPGI